MSRNLQMTTLAFFAVTQMLACFGLAQAPLREPDRKLVDWFDELPFPRFDGLKLVRVATGAWSHVGNEPPTQDHILALLLEERGESFTILTLDLETQHFSKSIANTPSHQQVVFELRDLRAEVTDQLKQLEDPEKQNMHMLGDSDSGRVKLFTLARTCLAQNCVAEAQLLLDAAAKLPSKFDSFDKALREDLAYLMTWRAILEFGELKTSRTDLLVSFQKILQHFPDSRQTDRVRQTVSILETMVAEDRTHLPSKQLTAMTDKERIAELVFQLRDQNGRQWSQPGWCDVFDDPRGEESPAAQLRSIGFAAVPELINAIDDNRFTRSVEFHRDFYFSHRVLSVGECAEAIIAQIAQRRFRDQQKSDVKRNIEFWWNEIKDKGERQVLIEAASLGNQNSIYQSKRLIEKYPADAFAAIRQGILKCEQAWIGTKLVELVSSLEDDYVQDLLLEQMNKAPGVSTRVAAANGLLSRKHPDPIPSMIQEWRRSASAGNTSGEEGVVARFLANCGSSDAISALSTGFPSRSVDLRFDVVSEFNPAKYHDGDSREQRHHQDPAVESAIEEFLIGCLEDTEPQLGSSGGFYGHSYTTNPRICDMSAYVLSVRFDEKYRFDALTPLHERDRQVQAIQNSWRRHQNLPALPTPERVIVAQLSKEQTQPQLARIANAKTWVECQQPMTELQRLGLPALSSIGDVLRTLAPDHPASEELRKLASQMANEVTEIEFENKSTPPDKTVREHLESHKGKLLDADNFFALLTNLIRDLPPGARGATLSAYRYSDNTGVRLMLRLHHGKVPIDRSEVAWSTHESVDIGVKSIYNSSGSSVYDFAIDVGSHDDFKKVLEGALASPPSESVLIRAAIQGSE